MSAKCDDRSWVEGRGIGFGASLSLGGRDRQSLDTLSRKVGLALRYRFEAMDGLVACQMAGAGLGVAIADPFVADSSGAEGLVMRRFRPRIPMEYGLIFPAWQARSQSTVELAKLVAQAGKEAAASLAQRGL